MPIKEQYKVQRVIYGDGRVSYQLTQFMYEYSRFSLSSKYGVILERPCLHMLHHEIKQIKQNQLSKKVISTTVLENF